MTEAHGMDLEQLMTVLRRATGNSFVVENWDLLSVNGRQAPVASKDLNLFVAAAQKDVNSTLIAEAARLMENPQCVAGRSDGANVGLSPKNLYLASPHTSTSQRRPQWFTGYQPTLRIQRCRGQAAPFTDLAHDDEADDARGVYLYGGGAHANWWRFIAPFFFPTSSRCDRHFGHGRQWAT